MWFFNSGKRRRQRFGHEQPLFMLSRHDAFTIGDSVEGTLVTGATGSGKTSGPGQCLVKSFLAAGYGGLVLTAKNDLPMWKTYCKQAGRSRDLRVFSPSEPLVFNFLDYELNRKGVGAGQVENLVSLFSELAELAERQGGQGGNEEPYWRRATRQLVRAAIDVLVLATGKLSIPDLYRLVVSAATSVEQVRSEDWRKRSFCHFCLQEADARPKTESQAQDFAIDADYLLIEYPALSSKTRSVIVSTFTSMVDMLNRGVLRQLFCTGTNITPEAVCDGAIIVIDLPVKEYGEVGLIAQVLMKLAFQKAIERRNMVENSRPVFLWMDEAQCFVTSTDMQFQATCRSSNVATVMLTQNVGNFYAALGGSEKGKAETDSLFGNFNTKIFCSNGDPVTNDWAASIVGRSRQFLTNSSCSYQAMEHPLARLAGYRGPASTNTGLSETIDFEVQPRAFTTLRKGGPSNGWLVDSVVFQGGRRFHASGKTWLKVAFAQK
jgi:type IV secretory pathway TraG/TraD family ATPase VirD4